MRPFPFVFLILLGSLILVPVPLCHGCISDPLVTVVYNLTMDTDLLRLSEVEGFSYSEVHDSGTLFTGERDFVMYKAHYGLATAMVAEDMLVLKAHEEKYNWEKGIRTELLFLQTIGVLKEHPDIDAIAGAASWESTSGRNIFKIPEGISFVSFDNEKYPVSPPVATDYFYVYKGWIAVAGNATVTAEGDTLSIILYKCGGDVSADTSKLSVFAPFREVILVCNSIDYEMTGKELASVLKEKGFIVRRITPEEFDVYRWFSPRIILLGGHQSPEGMGEIVGRILTETEKKMIEKTGPFQFAHDDVDFKHQSMLFFAGKDREGTREIALARVDDIVMWLQYQG